MAREITSFSPATEEPETQTEPKRPLMPYRLHKAAIDGNTSDLVQFLRLNNNQLLPHTNVHVEDGAPMELSQSDCLRSTTGAQSIGVCYGMLGNNLPSKADVVKMYQSNGITGMRIYNADSASLNALKGTKINLIMDVGLSDASSSSAASTWVNNNVKPHYPDVSFKYIAVGNEINGSDVSKILPAMKNIYSALSSAGLQNSIKVSTAVGLSVLGTSYPPSAGAFSSDASYMTSIVQYLDSINSPLLANIYPYFTYAGNTAQISLEYALFTSPGTVVTDGSNEYQNLFDAQVDALYSAMEKVPYSAMKKVGGPKRPAVVVTESGWPSAGGISATESNAQIYNQNLINHVGKGTPKSPTALETYIFAMFNENQKPAGVDQNWGLFYPNKQPVYSINFK